MLNTNLRSAPLTCIGHSRPVVDVHFSELTSDNKYYMITASKDGKPMLRDGQTGDWIGTFSGHKGAVWSARLSRGAHRAVTGAGDFTAKVWDTATGEELFSFQHKHIVRSVNFCPEGTRIITGGQEKILRIYDLYRPDTPMYESQDHVGTVRATLWHPNGNIIMSGGEDGGILVKDLRQMKTVCEFTTGGPLAFMNFTSSHEAVYWANEKNVHVWSLAQGFNFDRALENTIEVRQNVSCLSVHPKGETFVYGSDSDPWLRICDAMSGTELDTRKGHHGPIHSVSYSPDGELYATGSEDGTVRLWQSDPSKSYGLWERV
ncbi:WD40-repeat-containing domain protein [Dichotomocladium elegans]|nr:WD40-repeat-containing domain protein [Dichotomocladium elegans]